jgi:UPF0176 protein
VNRQQNAQMDHPFLTAAFYKFFPLNDPPALREPLLAHCDAQGVKGLVLLAHEGINGTIAGAPAAVQAVLAWLRASHPSLANLQHKEGFASLPPFHRMKVRLKREIVTMGQPDMDPSTMAGTYVQPQDWNALIQDPDVLLIDTRNDYEVDVGTFAGAINPRIKNFSELPAWLDQQEALKAKPKVAMFCTGGIRCEKSTAYLKSQGFNQVYHLEGGILKYLETVPEQSSLWRGECFVFDERVAVGHGLKPGQHELCRACRDPISPQDKTSPLFVQGISCPRCHGRKTPEQRQRAIARQRQVELAADRQQAHIGDLARASVPAARNS